ncbi:transcriptional regulator, AsnC family [Luminiphilus syltensis NOR5-1B]|uniref:Transcriptional regulator, AsnC family n=1 Tax=Luminiphilus syltensis NOR5-1B TaxID=565045 RepID=B8KY18_9GAMM|nr:Lrp/AsnC family transcriptional regulator [Luminiphilus syltensis]EED35356.1 transcriptional regulator, AsnC family [Luminiphilus syltensis NOR5-1B]
MLENVDRRILAALQTDASLSLADLSDRIALSRSACGRRLQRLESEGYIKGRVTLLNAEKVGLPLTVFISIKTNQHTSKWAERFHKVVEKLPGVLEVYRMAGETDYLLKAVVPDMPGYDQLYQQLIKAELTDVSSGFVMEEIKSTVALPL